MQTQRPDAWWSSRDFWSLDFNPRSPARYTTASRSDYRYVLQGSESESIKVNQSNPSGFRGEALRGGVPGRRLGQRGTSCGATGFGEVAAAGAGGVGGFPVGEAPFVVFGNSPLARLFNPLREWFFDSGGSQCGGAGEAGEAARETEPREWAASAVSDWSLASELEAQALSPDDDAGAAAEDADLAPRFSRRSSRRSRAISRRTFWSSARCRAITPLVRFL
jgi:hypothetical protein